MDAHTIYSASVPTPFGPVMTTHEHYELNSILRFQTELLSLHRAVTPARSAAEPSAAAELLPALIPTRHSR